jgi:hypothetical protein
MKFHGLATAGVVTAVMIWSAFAFGLYAGADLEQNESAGEAELSQSVDELEQLPENVTSELQENMTGVRQTLAVNVARPPSRVTATAGIYGLRIGYYHPALAKPLGRVALLASLLGIVGLVGYRLNRLRRMI